MSHRGYAQSAFSRNIDEMLRSAETALVQRSPHRAVRDTHHSDPNELQHYDRRVESSSSSNVDELGRQLRLCMRELQELRSELHTERESRAAAASSYLKRAKEEISVEVRQGEHTLRQELRSVEASMIQRISAIEHGKVVEKSRADEAMRMAKVNQSSMFDLGEQLKDNLEDMRAKVDRGVAQNATTREECAAIVEREKQRLSVRLDAEIARINESNRGLIAQVAEAKSAVAREVQTVSKDIGQVVEQAWKTQLRGTDRHVEHKLSEFQVAMEKMHSQLTDESDRSNRRAREVHDETKQLQATLGGRISSLESTVPLLESRVDRCERRAEGAMEGATRAAAEMDILRDACEKAVTQGNRSIELSKKVESMIDERDSRITHIETNLASLSGIDKWKQELEGTRRTQLRLESQIDALHQSAEKDARTLATMQRTVDDTCDKVTDAGRKVAKAVSSAEVVGQRLTSITERLAATEDSVGVAYTKATEAADAAERVALKSSGHDARITSSTEKVDASLRDAFSRLSSLDIKMEGIADAISQVSGVGPTIKRDVERLERRIAKSEAALANAVDNIQDTRDALDTTGADLAALQRRSESIAARPKETIASVPAREVAQLESRVEDASMKAVNALTRMDRVEERIFGRIETVSQELGSRIHELASRINESRSETFDVSSIGASQQLEGDVSVVRRRMDVFESRLRSVEELANDIASSGVKRADVQSIAKSSVTHLSQSVEVMKQELAELTRRMTETSPRREEAARRPQSSWGGSPTPSRNSFSLSNAGQPPSIHVMPTANDTAAPTAFDSEEGSIRDISADQPSSDKPSVSDKPVPSAKGMMTLVGSESESEHDDIQDLPAEQPTPAPTAPILPPTAEPTPIEHLAPPPGDQPTTSPQSKQPSWLESESPKEQLKPPVNIDDFDDDEEDAVEEEAENEAGALEEPPVTNNRTPRSESPQSPSVRSASEESSDSIPELPVDAGSPTSKSTVSESPARAAPSESPSRVVVPSMFNESSSSSDGGLPDNTSVAVAKPEVPTTMESLSPPKVQRKLPMSAILSKTVDDFDSDEDEESESGSAQAYSKPPLASSSGGLLGRGARSPPVSIPRSKVSTYSKQTADVSLSLSTTSPRTRKTDFDDDDDDDDDDVDDDALAAMLGAMK